MSYGCDWVCKCGWGNLDIRLKCRNCGTPNPEPRLEYIERAAALMRKAKEPPRILSALTGQSTGVGA